MQLILFVFIKRVCSRPLLIAGLSRLNYSQKGKTSVPSVRVSVQKKLMRVLLLAILGMTTIATTTEVVAAQQVERTEEVQETIIRSPGDEEAQEQVQEAQEQAQRGRTGLWGLLGLLGLLGLAG